MKWNYHLGRWSTAAALCLISLAKLYAADPAPTSPPLLKSGERIVVAGDMATAGCVGGYPRVIEIYLTACRPDLNAQILNVGTRTPVLGLINQLPLMILPYKPDLVTLCYGQEDSLWLSFSPAQDKTFGDNLGIALDQLKAAGVQTLVGSPVAVDSYYYKNVYINPATGAPNKPVDDPAAAFNETMALMGDKARSEAESRHLPFVDIHADLISGMKKAKDALGADYVVLGLDKTWPSITPNGQLLIATSFLKAMGLTGDIGTITLDMKGKATATEGHRVLSSGNGKVELESSRYPYCFTGDGKSQGDARSILPFVSFNRDLNRFTLVVKNLGSEKANVTWGDVSKTFTKEELASGINLAEAFAEKTPFSETFKKIEAAVAVRQANADRMFASTVNIERLFGKDQEGIALRDAIRQKFFDKLEKTHAEIKAMVVPLTHTLTITPA